MRTPSRAKAVKNKCLECSGHSPTEVTLCAVSTCPLWPFRTGNNTSKTYWTRVSRALRVHPDVLGIWIENGMPEEDAKKYRGLSTLFKQKKALEKRIDAEKIR